MAHVLDIVYGSTTIHLGSAGCGFRYTPGTPAPDAESITEPVTLWVTMATIADLQTWMRGLNNALRQSRNYQKYKIGDRVYVQFEPDGYGEVYRSEILDGQAAHDEETLGVEWLNKQIKIILSWTRRPYWEGQPVSLSLTNGGGSGITATIYNHGDATAGHDNFVKINAADIAGDLPAACKITLLNNYAASGNVMDVHIAHNVLSYPNLFSHVLEAEYATGGTPTVDANCSNGNYNNVAWAATTETKLLDWTFGSADVEYARGAYFRLIARFQTVPAYTDMWYRWKVVINSLVAWSGPLSLLGTSSLQDLGVVQIPPGGDLPLNLDGLNLVLFGKRNAGGTHTLKIDNVQMLALDGYRKLKGIVPVAYTETLIDDMIDGPLYTYHPGNLGHHTHSALGKPIRLWPGVDQKLYFLHSESTGAAPIARTLVVGVDYRPRRVTL